MKQTVNNIPNFTKGQEILANGKIGLTEIISRSTEEGKFLAEFLDEGIHMNLLSNKMRKNFGHFARMSHMDLMKEYKKDKKQFEKMKQDIELEENNRRVLIKEFYDFVENFGKEKLVKFLKESINVKFNLSDPIYRYYGDMVYQNEFSFSSYNYNELLIILDWLKKITKNKNML